MKLLVSMERNGVNNTGLNRDGGSEFHTERGKDLKAKGPGSEERLGPGKKKRGGGHEGDSLASVHTVFTGSQILRHS